MGGEASRCAGIPLRSYWLHRRAFGEPCVRIGVGALELFLPRFLGEQPWSIPVGEVAAAALAGVDDLTEFVEGTAVMQGLRLSPLPTTSVLRYPTLALLFDAARKVPPFRLLAGLGLLHTDVGVAESRQGKARVDGVLLRVVDAAEAVARLAAAGVETVEPHVWLRRRVFGG